MIGLVFGLLTAPLNSDQIPIQKKLIELESTIKDYQNPLDSWITEQDLNKRLQTLKPNKSSGPDAILNEMLKHCSKKFQSAILKLFNLILTVGLFPDIWNHGLITPIYKGAINLTPTTTGASA